MASGVNDWSDSYTSDYLRDLNTHGPASANVPRPSVVSHQVRYQSPVVQTEARTNGTPMYTEDDARGAYVVPASGYRAPAGGGWDVNSSDTNLRFPNESGGRRYARSKTKASAKPAWKRTQKPAAPSGDDVTSTVVQAVRADGNTSFANWRQSLKNEGWTEEQAKAIVYDPSSGKFINTAKSPSPGGALTPEEQAMAERAASHSAETPAKTEGGAQPAPAKTEGSAQPAPAKTEGSTQPAPADDHEQEVKAAVDEFLKQHPVDGKERLKSIYAAVDSQNIKDDAAYNLAVLAEIQKASTASGDTSDVDNILNNPGNTGAVDLGKAVLSERQAQTESGVNAYQDQIREGINWLRMFHAPDDPAGVRAKAVITAIGDMLRSSDPERYKHAVEELEKQKSYVIAANDAYGSKLFHDAMDGNIVTPDSIRAAEYARQLRAANAAKAQAAAEAAEQRSDNPEGWL